MTPVSATRRHVLRGPRLFASAAMALALASCGEDGGTGPLVVAPAPTPTPTPAPTPTPTPPPLGSLGADGWAATSTGTTGGNGAVAAKTYTVTNRNELIQAIYGGTATIAADGSFTGTLDAEKKIIYVRGLISLNVDQSLRELTADDYVKSSCASTQYGFGSEAALWTAYYAAYRPSVWGTATVVSGVPESARVCAAQAQRRVVMLNLPSNTSIIGVGNDARIVHGNLVLGTNSVGIDNVVVRNVTFEDSFDYFPQWDPTDSTTGRWNSAYDLISVLNATHVWIDRSTFSDGARIDRSFPSVWTETVNGTNYAGSDFKVQHHDGAVDVTRLGNLVTVSNSLFFSHDKSFLIGGSDTASRTAENPTVLKVTFHDNYFRNLRQRQPRVRYGMVHVYNNLYEGTLEPLADYPWSVGYTVGQSGKIYAENNVFVIAPGAAPATVANLWSISVSAARSTACVALGYSTPECTATFFDQGSTLNGVAVDITTPLLAANSLVRPTAWMPSSFYTYTLKPTASVTASVVANAGAGRP
jgi:pectate lyase